MTQLSIPYPPRQNSTDPVVQDNRGHWWWYDETWGNTTGPYKTREEAQDALNHYCENVLGK